MTNELGLFLSLSNNSCKNVKLANTPVRIRRQSSRSDSDCRRQRLKSCWNYRYIQTTILNNYIPITINNKQDAVLFTPLAITLNSRNDLCNDV